MMFWQADDRMALVGKDDIDVELGNLTERNSHLPPQWLWLCVKLHDQLTYHLLAFNKQ